jgi:hypothetical protein
MPDRNLHPTTYTSVVKAFGEPTATIGKNAQWTIAPMSGAGSIHMLLDSSHPDPVVWVFNPHQAGIGNSFHTVIHDEKAIASLIRQIQDLTRTH